MLKVQVVIGALVLAVATGCTCSNSSYTINDPDSGSDLPPGDEDGGDTSNGNDAGFDGGTGNNGFPDAGDPTIVGVINGADGGLTLNPSAPGSPVGTGVSADSAGNIVLDANTVDLHFMWIANSANGTVSKYDTENPTDGTPAKELGRYWGVVPYRANGTVDLNQKYQVAAAGRFSPSRTAIDLYGDVWVANRAPGVGGSITKIANDIKDCLPNRDGDPALKTSRDVGDCTTGGPNGSGPLNGRIDGCEMFPPANAPQADFDDPTKYDECVIFTTPIGGTAAGVGARGLAIAPPQGLENVAGDPWVAVWNEARLYKVSAITGEPSPIDPANTGTACSAGNPCFFDLRAAPASWPGTVGPYGAAVDGLGRLWAVSAPGDGPIRLTGVDSKTGQHLVTTSPPTTAPFAADNRSYGIGIDGKHRVWLAGWTSHTVAANTNGEGMVFRYDHPAGGGAGTWSVCNFKDAVSDQGTKIGRLRGVAARTDGTIWISGDYLPTGGRVAHVLGFNAETCAPIRLKNADFIDTTDANSKLSIGIGLDRNGDVWVNNFGDETAAPVVGGNVFRLMTATGDVWNKTPHGYQSLTINGSSVRGALYSYSDFTGYQVRNFTSPRGTYARTFSRTCVYQWKALTWTGTSNPPVTEIRARVRVASTEGGLTTATPTAYVAGGASGGSLDLTSIPNENFIRVEFELATTDRQQPSPVLKGYSLTAEPCPLQ